MKNSFKNIFRHKIWVLSFFLIFSGISNLYSQCKIIAPTTKFCRGNSITFTVNTTAPSYVWNSGDGKTENKQVATFMYDHYGVFKLKVILYNNDLTVKCSDSLILTVYDLPNANMQNGDSIEVCSNKDYCFINKSTVSANNSPLKQFLWLFGDGDISYLKNPCHRYDFTGDYLIFLNVKDSNGCESKLEKKVHIIVGAPLKPKFTIFATDSCPVTKAWFNNVTDTTGKNINKFIIDYGDGTKDSSVSRCNFFHTYTKDSSFVPTLTVINYLGCRETFYSFRTIVNTILNLKFDISAFPTPSCWPDSIIQVFQTPPTGYVEKFLWEFGDPMSGSKNYNMLSWNPYHTYPNPGMYDIRLIVESSFCRRDTTICHLVKIQGPRARINLPSVTNNCLSNHILPISKFYHASSLCLNHKGDSIKYTRLSTVPKYVRTTIDTFCNADTLSFYVNKKVCGDDTVYTLKPTGTKKIYDTLSIFYNYWFPGDPIPTGTTYYPPLTNCNPQVMHDTDFFPLNCGAPNYVRFTNNSIKFRNYNAIDDKPPFSTGIGKDQCKNRSYPWASDSLRFFWDFDDNYAPACTSTYSNINILCRYSTEKVPWHLYKNDGCFTAVLTVTDPVTKCLSRDSVFITMQKPDAGWDTSAYDYLNYKLQLLKPPIFPRRGVILEGMPCLNSQQFLNLNEVLPNCHVQDWGIVIDSAKDCVHICSDTGYFDIDMDGKLDTIVNHKDSCSWITKDTYIKYYNSSGLYYTSTGCKTMGFWIKSGDCIDTFWYHNYKYISTSDPQFQVMDPDSVKRLQTNKICPGFKPVLTVINKKQEGILSFAYDIRKLGSPAILYRTNCTMVKDTLLVLANRSTLKDIIYFPPFGCADDPLKNAKLSDLLINYLILDTVFVLSLEDTIFTNFALIDPGNYRITSSVTNTNGCSSGTYIDLTIGLTADFYACDTVLCLNDTTSFPYSVKNFNGYPTYGYVVNFDFNDDGILDTGDYFKYSKPGIYTVRMYVTDTICKSVMEITKAHYIYVGGINAEFDSTNSPSNCAPQVVGFEDRSKLLTPYIYKYDSAGNKIDSMNYDFVTAWQWNFGDDKGSNSFSTKQNPTHAFTSNGDFDISLLVISARGCVDTIKKPRYIRIDGPKPRFDLLDTIGCVPFAARFIDTSRKVSNWIWQLGDNTQVSGLYNYGDTVTLTYNRVGVFYPNLIGTDSVYNVYMKTYTKCTSIFPDPLNPNATRYKVTVLPLNRLKFFGDSIICSGQNASFTDQSDTSYNQIYWDFGDSSSLQSDQGAKISHTFSIPEDEIIGKFDISMRGDGSVCPDSFKPKTVTVKRVIADIVWDSTLNTEPVFCFRNNTKGGKKYDWSFKDGIPAALKVTDTNYKCTNYFLKLGVKTVCLKSVNEIGCTDEICVDVKNNYDVMIDIPNVFTPGNSISKNDTFTIASKNIELYILTIYNRWGSVVFESNNPKKHWDGIDIKKGKPCSPGTYYYVLEYKFRHIAPKRVSGTISLFR